jgi:hypothetical protein
MTKRKGKKKRNVLPPRWWPRRRAPTFPANIGDIVRNAAMN